MIIRCAACGIEIEKRSNTHECCVACVKVKHKKGTAQWIKIHREQINDAKRESYATDPSKTKRRNELWRKRQPEKARESVLRSRNKNRERINAKKRERYAANADEINRRNKLRHDAHPEKRRESDRRYRAENPDRYREKHREISRRWEKNNPEKVSAAKYRRRCTLGSFTAIELKAKFEEMGNKCAHCGTTEKKLTVDHIVPLNKNGTNFIDNIQPLCGSCNSSKGARFIG